MKRTVQYTFLVHFPLFQKEKVLVRIVQYSKVGNDMCFKCHSCCLHGTPPLSVFIPFRHLSHIRFLPLCLGIVTGHIQIEFWTQCRNCCGVNFSSYMVSMITSQTVCSGGGGERISSLLKFQIEFGLQVNHANKGERDLFCLKIMSIRVIKRAQSS